MVSLTVFSTFLWSYLRWSFCLSPITILGFACQGQPRPSSTSHLVRRGAGHVAAGTGGERRRGGPLHVRGVMIIPFYIAVMVAAHLPPGGDDMSGLASINLFLGDMVGRKADEETRDGGEGEDEQVCREHGGVSLAMTSSLAKNGRLSRGHARGQAKAPGPSTRQRTPLSLVRLRSHPVTDVFGLDRLAPLAKTVNSVGGLALGLFSRQKGKRLRPVWSFQYIEQGGVICPASLPESLFEMVDPSLHKITQWRQAKSVAAAIGSIPQHKRSQT